MTERELDVRLPGLSRRRVLGAIGVLPVALAACGVGGGDGTPKETRPSGLNGTFDFTVQSFQPTVNIIERAIPAFQEKNPGAKITFSQVAFSEMAAKTRTAVAAGAGPDGF